jgi:hypothetical protein
VWRNWLRGSDRPERIFEAVRAVIAETGVLRSKRRRALDSVVLDDAVATRDTVTQLIAAVRRVRREVPGAAELIAKDCCAHDWDDPGKSRIAWNDRAARGALVNDATLIVDTFHHGEGGHAGEQDGEDRGSKVERAGQALALLALVARQDVEPADGSDGTDMHKSVHHRRDGFKAHLALEPDRPDTGSW